MIDTSSPQAVALIEAALNVIDERGPVQRLEDVLQHLTPVVDAYRAANAPKECRPPEGAKDGSLWWLVCDIDNTPQLAQWSGERWKSPAGADIRPSLATADGYSVHSECRFPGERVADGASVYAFVTTEWNFGDGNPGANAISDLVEAALHHFVAPKLRPISEERIDEIMHQAWVAPHTGITESLRIGARAILAEVTGDGE